MRAGLRLLRFGMGKRGLLLGLVLLLLIFPGLGEGRKRPSQRTPAVVLLAPEEARSVLRALRSEIPEELASSLEVPTFARLWTEWAKRQDARIRARLIRGEEDSLINFLLFGTSFTRHPRVTEKELEALTRGKAEGIEETVSRLLRGRLDDLLQALARPGSNERLLFVRHLLRRQGYDPASAADRPRLRAHVLQTLARVLREQQALARALEEAKALGNPAEEFLRRSALYRERGLSPDTSLWPNLALEEALKALHVRGLLRERSVCSVAVIGPGLDFTDKQEGFDFYPLQTIQPFAVIEMLRRLGLAQGPTVRVYALDVSPRVIKHLERARRQAARGLGYTVQLPLDPTIPWRREALAFWERFGTEIGQRVAPARVPPALASLRLRAIRIRPDVVRQVIPVNVNIVLEHLDLPASQALDLVIATNVLVYYDVFEQSLALKNIEKMLRPGGILLSNNALPELPTTRIRSLGYSTTVYSDRPDDGDHIIWYRRQEDEGRP